MTKTDGRRRGDPKSDRGITWVLVLGLLAILVTGGYFYGGAYMTTPSTASASGTR
jgi:hypothetical protein